MIVDNIGAILLIDSTYQLPSINIRFHPFMRSRYLRPRKHLIDNGPDLTARQMMHDLLDEDIPQLPLIRRIPRPQRRSQHPDALVQQRAQVEAVDLAPAHRRHEHDPGILRRGRRVAVPVVPPDQVDDEVDAPAGGFALHGFGEVFGAVVDRDVRAQGAAEGALLVAAGCGEDFGRAAFFGDLNGRLAHA